jgi:hypothetical protein
MFEQIQATRAEIVRTKAQAVVAAAHSAFQSVEFPMSLTSSQSSSSRSSSSLSRFSDSSISHMASISSTSQSVSQSEMVGRH